MHWLPFIPGIASLALTSAVLLYAVRYAAVRAVLLSLLMYASVFGRYEAPWFSERLVPALELLRAHGRDLVLVLLALLLLPAAARIYTARPPVRLDGRFAFLLFQVLFSCRLAADDLADGARSLALFFVLFAIFGVAMPSWLRSVADAQVLLRGAALTGVWIAITTGYQALFSVTAMRWAGRFFGMTGNAQHAGTLIASVLLPTVYLLTNRAEPRRNRCLWLVLAAILAVLLLWTGSRTAILMVACGMLTLFRRRLLRVLPVLIFGAAICAVALYATPELHRAFRHLGSTHNSRQGSFRVMLDAFQSSPWLGTGDQAIAESSYLAAAAATGLLGLGVFAATGGLTAIELWQLRRTATSAESQELLDFALGGFVMLAVGAISEAYLLGVVNAPILLLNICYALLAFLRKASSRLAPAASAAGTIPGTE